MRLLPLILLLVSTGCAGPREWVLIDHPRLKLMEVGEQHPKVERDTPFDNDFCGRIYYGTWRTEGEGIGTPDMAYVVYGGDCAGRSFPHEVCHHLYGPNSWQECH